MADEFLLTPAEKMAAAKLYATEAWPYFADGIYALSLHEADDVLSGDEPTMASDTYWRVYYHPRFALQHDVPVLAGGLTHELLHLLHAHAERVQELPDPHLEAWQIASDLPINEIVLARTGRAHQTRLPSWAYRASAMGLRTGETAEQYYDQLLTLPRSRRPRPQVAAGCCGSAADGQPRAYELAPPSDREPGLTGAPAERVRLRVAEATLQESQATGAGTVPAGLLRWAQRVQAPTVNYAASLRALLSSTTRQARGFAEYRYTQRHRRQHLYDRIILPGLVDRRYRVGFAFDTSGSMSPFQLGLCQDVLGQFFARHLRESEVYISSFDAVATTPHRCRTLADVRLVGGGGTDIRVAFQVFASMRTPPHLILCLTDCLTPWPASPPPRTRVVVIRVGRGALPSWPHRAITLPPVP